MNEAVALQTMVFYDLPYILSIPVVFMLVIIIGTFYFSPTAWKRLEGAFIVFLVLFLVWIVSNSGVVRVLFEAWAFWHYLSLVTLYLMGVSANVVLYEVLEPRRRPFLRRVILAYTVLAAAAYALELAGLDGLERGRVIFYPLLVLTCMANLRLLYQSGREGNTYSRAVMLPCLGIMLLGGLDGVSLHWHFFPWHTFLLPIGVYSLVLFALLMLREQLLREQVLQMQASGLEENIRRARLRSDADELTGCKSRAAFDRKMLN